MKRFRTTDKTSPFSKRGTAVTFADFLNLIASGIIKRSTAEVLNALCYLYT